jgi:hypothetical protein
MKRSSDETTFKHSAPAVAMRIVVILAIVIGATWAAHLVRETLGFTITPENEQAMHRAVVLGVVAYVVLTALPFVPGAEIGIAMLTAFGADIAPLIYGATIISLLLAFSIGRLLPIDLLARLLAFLRLKKASALVTRAAVTPDHQRLALLLDGAPPRMLDLALRYRYIALAVLINTPGNAIIGGGGGIMMLAAMSGIFMPLPTLLTVAIAVCPVPLAVLLFGA